MGVIEYDLRALCFADFFKPSLYAFEVSERVAGDAEIHTQFSDCGHGKQSVRKQVRARRAEGKHTFPSVLADYRRLSCRTFENSRNTVCTYVVSCADERLRIACYRIPARALSFRVMHICAYIRMRARAYESVFRLDYGMRTFFDKFRENRIHLANIGITVGVVAFHIRDHGNIGGKRKQMPAVFAGFRQKYSARKSAVSSEDRQFAHSDGLPADVRHKRDARALQNVRYHCGDGRFAVRARDRDHTLEIIRDTREEFVSFYNGYSERFRTRYFGIGKRHGGRTHHKVRITDYVLIDSRVNLYTRARQSVESFGLRSVAARDCRARQRGVLGKRGHRRSPHAREMNVFPPEIRHTKLYAPIFLTVKSPAQSARGF